MIRDIKGKVEDLVPVRNVLMSVYNKTGLVPFAQGILKYCPDVKFISSGGTYKELQAVVPKGRLREVSEVTGFPEMEGGLVKTLHPAIHGGILGEANNPAHIDFIEKTHGVFIDMVVVNLYPFEEVIKKIERGEIDPKTGRPYNFESGRGHIDIGGPAMLRGASKNFLRCLAVCNPASYVETLNMLKENNGSTTLDRRTAGAICALARSGNYDTAIANWMDSVRQDVVRSTYGLGGS